MKILITRKFVVRNFVTRNFVVRNFVVRTFVVRNLVVGNYVLETSHFIEFIMNRLLLLSLSNYRPLIIISIIIVNWAIIATIDYFQLCS